MSPKLLEIKTKNHLQAFVSIIKIIQTTLHMVSSIWVYVEEDAKAPPNSQVVWAPSVRRIVVTLTWLKRNGQESCIRPYIPLSKENIQSVCIVACCFSTPIPFHIRLLLSPHHYYMDTKLCHFVHVNRMW